MEPDPTALGSVAAALVAEAGWRGTPQLEPLPGGANNRVFRVRVGGKSALLKVYFQHPGDKRDRLHAEYSFSQFAWGIGLRCLPEPLACDRQNQIGLFEFIEGRRLEPVEVTPEAVEQALDFFRELNCHQPAPAAQALPVASEACFSVAEHLQTVERRVLALRGVEDASAAAFVCNELWPCWREIASRIPADPVAVERCISPSDFGFHNALREASGRLRFVDFEYAGWDDPAKMVCDFFCQPARPIPRACYETVVVRSGASPDRVAQLLPVYRVKWCCIMLNDFLSVASQRRQFAQRDDTMDRRIRQLAKARQILTILKEPSK